MTRVSSDHPVPDTSGSEQPADSGDRPQANLSGAVKITVAALRVLGTMVMLAGGATAALFAWNYYVTSPWTRDGRVRVQVASVAPQVSGQITEVRVVDDEYVRKGDVLYIVDRFDFQNALDQARTQVEVRAADFQVKQLEAERRAQLSDLATTPEQQQQYRGNAMQAQANFKSAQVQASLAEVNLARTLVRAPVNGFITNLQLRVGDFARTGVTNLSIIDAESFWIDGYFEETKMAGVCIGDRAEARLMGYANPILGTVESIARGIAVSDAATSTQGLPNVDPIYTWVRLAQRVPVRIRILNVPSDVPLVSGMTASVYVDPPDQSVEAAQQSYTLSNVGARLAGLVFRPPARTGCIPPLGSRRGRTVTIETPEPARAATPAEVAPGLAPGITAPPTAR